MAVDYASRPTLSAKEIAAWLHIDRHRWARLVKAGLAPAPVDGQRFHRLWSTAAILAWLAQGGNPATPVATRQP